MHLEVQGIKVPKFIKKLLIFAGYDNELSLTLLNADSIGLIETFVENNKTLATKSNICNDGETFKLNPGQITAILGLAEKCKDFVKKKNVQTNLGNSIQASTQLGTQEKTEDTVKSELIQKVVNYLNNLQFSLQFTLTDITEFEEKSGAYRCRMKCCFCEKKIVCNYKTYWIVSNLEAHLKLHLIEIKQRQITQKENSLPESSKETSSGIETSVNICASQVSNQDLNSVQINQPSASNPVLDQASNVLFIVNKTTDNSTMSEVNNILHSPLQFE